MNLSKLMLWFTGVMAVTTITATPLTAWAQTPQAQSSEIPRIVFSQDQQVKFEKLQAETIAQIYSALTEEQKTQFAEGIKNGQGINNVKNITESQKAKITAILNKFHDGMDEILTKEQKEQIQQFQMRNQQNQPNSNPPSAP